MTCDARHDQIFLYAADQLEAAEMQEVRRHLATGCPRCAGVLAEAQATLAQAALLLDPIEPRPETRDALMSRIASEAGEIDRAVEPSRPTPMRFQPLAASRTANRRASTSPYRLLATGLLSAAAAVAITAGVFVYSTRFDRSFLRSGNLQTVALTSSLQPAARGQVLWDRDHQQWHVALFNLQPPPAGREYELWFITPAGVKVPSKSFGVDRDGGASLIVAVPADIGPIATAAITDEPLGGVSVPTGHIQLVGNVQAAVQ